MSDYSDDKNPWKCKTCISYPKPNDDGICIAGQAMEIHCRFRDAWEAGWKACEKEFKEKREKCLILKRIEEDFEDPNIEDPEPLI